MKRYFISAAIFLLVATIGFNAPIQKAKAAYALTGSNSFSGTTSVAMPITDLQISGTGSEPVPVKLRVTSGTLAMSTTTGLTFTGGQTGATLQFSGSLTNVNNALATLTYTRGSTGTDTLEVSLVNPGEVFFEENGHLYKYISGTITWTNAQTAAAAQTAYDSNGYLATITSQDENNFVAARITGDGWFGASDSAVEGAWRWVTGPETGTQFWSGNGGGSVVGGNYNRWASGEPNDSGGEDCAQFYVSSNNWNDLPCNHNLGGYIVEFGAAGDLPDVVAKNISITTSSTPTVSTVSPTDNATNVSTTANLVVTFSQTVTKDTGNITIHKSSDNSIVETISVPDALVTGSGSATITINPSITLDESTSYYVNIPNTAFKNGSNAYYTGISNATTWNFTTGDFTAPNISALVATPTSNSSAITWTTNELASTRVSYGLTNALGTNTAETDTAPRVLSHSVTLNTLLACTTYHYQVTSKDASNNTTNSSASTFTTTGCEESAIPGGNQSTGVTVNAGGTSSLTNTDNTISVTMPANVTGAAASLVIQIHALDNEDILTALGKPASSPNEVGPILFDVKAIINGDTILDSFDAPVTIDYEYTDADIVGLDEDSLWLYHYHDNEWQRLEDCTVSTDTNEISCTTESFSLFALFGSAPSGSSGSYVRRCHDPAALNYTTGGKHSAEVCRYTATTAPTPVTAPPTSVFKRDLSFGMTGDDVRELQRYLNAKGYQLASSGVGSLGQETNWFGALTKNALIKFQNTNSISPANGLFNGRTRELISGQTIAAPVSTPVSAPVQSQPSISLVRDLTVGMSGADVKALQEILIGQGYGIAAGPTGYFASQTKIALSAFQKDKGVAPAIGYFGSLTRAAMKATGLSGLWW